MIRRASCSVRSAADWFSRRMRTRVGERGAREMGSAGVSPGLTRRRAPDEGERGA